MLDIYEFITWTKEERQAHLDLSSPCIFRGTNSTECRGLLAHALNTSVPRGRFIHCCHACHDGRCSNWRHLYWGTAAENADDLLSTGNSGLRPQYGERNGAHKKAPWKNTNHKRDEWAWAADIYDDYIRHCWDWHKYGKGRLFLESKYGLSQGPARTMIKRFRLGWIPIEDPEWLEEFKPE